VSRSTDVSPLNTVSVPEVPLEGTHIRGRESGGKVRKNGTYALGQVLDNDGLAAVDRNLECLADLSHPYAAQCTDPLDQHCG